jgi:hypothetical protein
MQYPQQPPYPPQNQGCKLFLIIASALAVGIIIASFVLWLVSSPDFWYGFCQGAPSLCGESAPTPTPYYPQPLYLTPPSSSFLTGTLSYYYYGTPTPAK